MEIWLVISGMFCFFIAYLADKHSKKLVADAAIFTGVFMIAVAVLFCNLVASILEDV